MYTIVDSFEGCDSEKPFAIIRQFDDDTPDELIECYATQEDAEAALSELPTGEESVDEEEKAKYDDDEKAVEPSADEEEPTEEEPVTKAESDAPNYRMGEGESVCASCVWAMEGSCELYQFDFDPEYTCDSWTDEVEKELHVAKPHGYLIAKGTQRSVASVDPLPVGKPMPVVCGSEVYAVVTLSSPTRLSIKEFTSDRWFKSHRIRQHERISTWPNHKAIDNYPISAIHVLQEPLPFVNGKVDRTRIVDIHKETGGILEHTPPEVEVDSAAITYDNATGRVHVSPVIATPELFAQVKAHFGEYPRIGIPEGDHIPLYSLTLKRNKHYMFERGIPAELALREKELDVVESDDEVCVIDIETGETVECYTGEFALEEALQHIADAEMGIEVAEKNAKGGMRFRAKLRARVKRQLTDLLDVAQAKITQVTNYIRQTPSQAEPEIDAQNANPPVADELQNTAMAYKTANGELWHLQISTNSFEDRHGEIITSEALERYVKAADLTGKRGMFNFWHIPNTDFARKEFQMVVRKGTAAFLIEAGPYLDTPFGREAKAFFEQHPNGHPVIAPEGWGSSPEFYFAEKARTSEGNFEEVWIVRSSTLPRFKAANIYTIAIQEAHMPLQIDDEKREGFKALFPKSADGILALVEGTADELTGAGKRSKEGDVPEGAVPEVDVAQTPEGDANESTVEDQPEGAQDIGKAAFESGDLQPFFDAIDETLAQPLIAAITDMDTRFEQRFADLESRMNQYEGVKEVESAASLPRWAKQLNEIRSATNADETDATDDKSLRGPKQKSTNSHKGSLANVFYGGTNSGE